MEIKRIINGILYNFNIELLKPQNRESIKFAKNWFNNKKIIACEVGVYRGYTSNFILKELNVNHLFLIDPFINDYNNAPEKSDAKEWEKDAHRLDKRYNNLTWIKEFSNKGFKKISKRIDFCYIDGNHNYKYVKEDLENYWKLINKKGIMAGHDIQFEGVSNAVIEFAEKYNLKISFGDRRDWWIVKKDDASGGGGD